MPTFSSKPFGKSNSQTGRIMGFLGPAIRKHPVVFFGGPFVLTVVIASYGLSTITQTRYDLSAAKVQTLSKEDALGMRKDRRKFDIREEYYRLQAKADELEEWEPKRVPRPEGMQEPLPPRSRVIEAEGPPMQRDRSDETNPSKSLGAGSSASSKRKDIILGPDGKPCRACNSKLAFSAAMRSSKAAPSALSKSSDASQADNRTTDLRSLSTSGLECPPDGEAIGRSTWAFLHSTAAYYPAKPDETQQSAMLSLVRALPHLYPCHTCASSLGEELEREGKDRASHEGGATLSSAVRSGPGLRKWLCGLHNEVNTRLGKPVWPCNEDNLRQRWLDGPDDGSCDA